MSYEISAYTREEAQASDIEFIGVPLNEGSNNDTSGPPICPPDRVAAWMMGRLKAGSIEPGAYTTRCDVLKAHDKVGKVWASTEMLFIAEDLSQPTY